MYSHPDLSIKVQMDAKKKKNQPSGLVFFNKLSNL